MREVNTYGISSRSPSERRGTVSNRPTSWTPFSTGKMDDSRSRGLPSGGYSLATTTLQLRQWTIYALEKPSAHCEIYASIQRMQRAEKDWVRPYELANERRPQTWPPAPASIWKELHTKPPPLQRKMPHYPRCRRVIVQDKLASCSMNCRATYRLP